jgi:hypothetical protein
MDIATCTVFKARVRTQMYVFFSTILLLNIVNDFQLL